MGHPTIGTWYSQFIVVAAAAMSFKCNRNHESAVLSGFVAIDTLQRSVLPNQGFSQVIHVIQFDGALEPAHTCAIVHTYADALYSRSHGHRNEKLRVILDKIRNFFGKAAWGFFFVGTCIFSFQIAVAGDALPIVDLHQCSCVAMFQVAGLARRGGDLICMVFGSLFT